LNGFFCPRKTPPHVAAVSWTEYRLPFKLEIISGNSDPSVRLTHGCRQMRCSLYSLSPRSADSLRQRQRVLPVTAPLYRFTQHPCLPRWGGSPRFSPRWRVCRRLRHLFFKVSFRASNGQPARCATAPTRLTLTAALPSIPITAGSRPASRDALPQLLGYGMRRTVH
jgi:hypothetical protein